MPKVTFVYPDGRRQEVNPPSGLSILEIARKSPEFNEFLASRIVSAEVRAESIKRIFRSRASDLVVNFLLVLKRKK